MLPRNVMAIFLAAIFSLLCYEKVQFNKYASTLSGVMTLIENKYVDNVDRRKLFEGAMDGMVKNLEDPYSSYISPEEYNRFEESLEQEFGGIGIVVEVNPKTKRLMVMNPLVGTPAHKAGLRAGDSILEIDGHSTRDLPLPEAVKYMRGKPGTNVALLVLHPEEDEPEAYQISRAIIPIESVLGDLRNADGTWNFLLEEQPRVAYLRITTFGEHTVDELKRALSAVKDKCDGVIIDLRDNAGGLLSAAVGACDLFLDHGRIVSTRGREGRIIPESREYEAKPDLAVGKDLPVVVLVNHFSASASEIMSACLQDHHRAVVVGERTWGKGTVQNVIPLEGGKSALKLTTASYWRPTLKNIHRRKDAKDDDDWGVRPNEGYEVKVEQVDARKVARYRRHRDLFGNRPLPESITKTTTPSEAKTNNDPEKSTAEAPRPKPANDVKPDRTEPELNKPESQKPDADAPSSKKSETESPEPPAKPETTTPDDMDPPNLLQESEPIERVKDMQLQRAIEYLLGKINPKA